MTSSPIAAEPRPARGRWLLPGIALLVLATSIATLALTQTPSAGVLWPRWAAMLALAWWLPGVLLVALWRLRDLDLPIAAVLSVALGLCWMILLLLFIHWWPGRIELWATVAVYALGSLALAAAVLRRPPLPLQPTPPSTWAWLLALLVLAGLLRLPGLGYHEFHIDEVLVLSRARDAIRGEDDAFARHTKGPGELAIATVLYRTLGTANEETARLPLGIISVAGVQGLALLGRRLIGEHFGHGTGFWAGLLFALNGFALGLTRILQYQAAVILLMILAVLAAWMYAQRGEARWITLAGLLSLFGVILHYEFALAAPVLLWMLWLGWQRDEQRRSTVWALSALALLGLALLAAAYIPTYLNPYFATTQYYLTDRLGNLGRTFNGPFFFEMGTFYNSIYFFGGLVLLAGIGIVLGWRRHRRATVLLILWFAPYLILYLFIVQYPGTHFYLLMPSWSILAALPLVAVTTPSVRRALRIPAYGLIAVWLIASAHYLHLMFFRQDPEYLINFRQERVPAYWAPYGENIPEKPRFGFPIWEGWKTLGVLSEWGYLNGTYTTNERSRHLRWYLGDFEHVPIEEEPDFIFVAKHVQEREPRFDDDWLDGYINIGEVRVRDEPRIALWSRRPPSAEYLVYDAETFDDIFDGQAPTFREWPDPPVQVEDVGLDDRLMLSQAGVEPTTVRAGDTVHLLLTWIPHQPLDRDYKLFVHVADADGRPMAQWDGLPGLNTVRTSQWSVGEPFRDHVLLPLPESLASGRYQVLVGLYDPDNGLRIGGKSILLSEIEVR